jgi:7,8-dihydroneopterin aldolase/epimerase/oxygenase
VILVELDSLELFGYHGVNEDEQRDGQRFLFDVTLEAGDDALSDRIEDAVNYVAVAALVREVSEGHRFDLIEALAAAVADAILARFPVTRATVRVRKPDVKLDPPVAWSAATVERRR